MSSTKAKCGMGLICKTSSLAEIICSLSNIKLLKSVFVIEFQGN